MDLGPSKKSKGKLRERALATLHCAGLRPGWESLIAQAVSERVGCRSCPELFETLKSCPSFIYEQLLRRGQSWPVSQAKWGDAPVEGQSGSWRTDER
jgi:hypothetical protein